MADEFAPLLQEELARMAAARTAWRAGGVRELEAAAHDLKGLGATFGAPLAGRIAASLERLLAAGDAPAGLVDAHVDAARAVVREGAAAAGDPRGALLAAALEAAVELRTAVRWPQAA
ncbi:MAG: Hpt domain-containing protein [Caulobacteraceae bacterium]|nr:Hpt domain-containing protein [Caulobacter sp.]